MTKTALITGITGQDGSYLSEYLLDLGYRVCGIIRRQSVADNQTDRIDYLGENIDLYYGDLTDEHSVYKIIKETEPDEVYNLGAMSHVRVSFDIPSFTIKTNSLGTLNVLEAVKELVPSSKVYQASSSEMFGNIIDPDGYQRLTTPMDPVSPYGISKLMSYNLIKQYRNGYKIHACNGILFNHESPRRGTTFVTNKVVKTAVEIKHGIKNVLELGNLDSYRDWGHSYDYVRAMHMLLNYQTPRDWIVATGESKSVRDLCKYTFGKLELDYEKYVIQHPKYFRKEEVNYLRGDSSEIREILGWKPKYTFNMMIDEMINFWEEKISNEKSK